MSSSTYSVNEVSKHNSINDCWIIIDDNVYNISEFINIHPGGKNVLKNVFGKDATKQFYSLHNPLILPQYDQYCIGKIQKENKNMEKNPNIYGSDIPFAEPYWYRGFKSPYYTNDHKEFRDTVRKFVEKEILPFIHEWDEKGDFPNELYDKAYKSGIYGSMWPKEYGGTPPNNCDAFHDFILIDELCRIGAGGILACFFSFGIALPPILSVGSDYLKDKLARDVITGKKIMCLAVTEPNAGSDVANLQTTAKIEGNYYIVNGSKKFITGGVKADYYTTAVRTGGKGMNGVSLLLLEKGMPGITVRRMKTQGWWTSNTAYIIFEDVKVPLKNLIGNENEGFFAIMLNFNHERFMLSAMSNRYARVCLEDAISYARKRKTFNKRLIDHQVIRHKISEMARHIECTHALLEQIAYQMKSEVNDFHFAGILALAKVQSTKTMEYCAREASQILGGNSYLRTGQGQRIERLYREVRVNAIGGGSEEILLDFAIRQARL